MYEYQAITTPPISDTEKQSMVDALRYRLSLLERKLKRCMSPTSEARVCAAIAALCTQINNLL